MARYHGKAGRVLLGSTTATPVASIDGWTLDLSADRVEVTSFGDLNKQYVLGFPDVSGTLTGFFDDTDTSISTGRSVAAGVRLYLYPDYTNAVTKYAYGTAFLDMSIDASAKDAVKISAKFSASSNWGINL